MPDLNGREAILKVHMKKIRMDENVSARKIAAGTPGLAGADLENLVNEAALLPRARTTTASRWTTSTRPARRSCSAPSAQHDHSTRTTKKITAYHEAGTRCCPCSASTPTPRRR